MNIDTRVFAANWIASWNSHDLESILDYYTDDLTITTTMIKVALGVDTGTLTGKESVRHYWATALAKIPDLHFELIDVTRGVDSVALYYRSVMNKMAIEVMYLNERNKIHRVIAHYSE